MKREDIPKPVISSACPVVVRLISVRFPSLLDNVIPIMPPVELAARIAKREALKKHPDLREEDICVRYEALLLTLLLLFLGTRDRVRKSYNNKGSYCLPILRAAHLTLG